MSFRRERTMSSGEAEGAPFGESARRSTSSAASFGAGGRERVGGLPAKSLKDEIRMIVRDEIAPLDRRLLALERVSDTNAVTVQQLWERCTQTLDSRSTELETRLASRLADATATAQSQLAQTSEQLELQLADHLDRLNAIDWAIQRQDVAFARSIDQVAASGVDGLQTQDSSSLRSSSMAPPGSPAVSRHGSGLNLDFTYSDEAVGVQRGRTRTASLALRETRAAQAEAEFGDSTPTAISQSYKPSEVSRRKLKTYLFDDAPESASLMGLIARDAADIERRLSSLEQKLDTERNVTLAALTDLESKLTRESLEREQSVQVAARAVMATQRLATNASAGSTITDLSRERGGALSPEDLSHVFHRHGVGVSSAEVAFVVTALDVDGSGSIDGTELEYLGSTAQDIINLASHVEQEVQAGMSELVARMQMEIRGASLGVRALQRLMTAKGNPQVVFQSLDTDGDGSLSRHELAVGFAQLGIQLSESELTETIKMLDTDGDGQVDLQEFVRMGHTATQLDEQRELQLSFERQQKALVEEVSKSVARQCAEQRALTVELNESTTKKLEEQQTLVRQSAAKEVEEQRIRLEHLLHSHSTEKRKLQTLPTWLRLMSRPDAADAIHKVDQSGSGSISRDDFVTLLSESLGEEVEEETVAGMIDLLGGLDKEPQDDAHGIDTVEIPGALQASAEDRREDVQMSLLTEISSLSRQLLENIEFTKDVDVQLRQEVADLIKKEKQARDELDQLLSDSAVSQQERERAMEQKNADAQAAAQAAVSAEFATERAAREAEAVRLREEAQQREQQREEAERQREEAERAAAEAEAARLAAEQEAARLAAEEVEAARKEQEIQEEALWQKKHGVVTSGWVSVELARKNEFVNLWCVLTPGLITMSEKKLMPARITYPLVGSTVEELKEKRKAVSKLLRVSIDVEAQKRVQGPQVSEDMKKSFIFGFTKHDNEEVVQEWRDKITAQGSMFATDKDIIERDRRLRNKPLQQFVDGLGLRGSIVKYGWLYEERIDESGFFNEVVQESRLCVISTSLLTIFEACPGDDVQQPDSSAGGGDSAKEPHLAQIPLARCTVTAQEKRKGMEGGSFCVKFSTEALAYATGEAKTEVLLSCIEPRKKGRKQDSAEDWQEKLLAQAFLPPSWLGDGDRDYDHVQDTLLTYDVDLVTGNVSGAGTKAQVFIELEGEVSGQVRRSGNLVVNAEKQELRRGQPFSFSFDATDLGELQKVKVGHDNSGFSANWQCEEIVIRQVSSGREWKVEVRSWFDAKKGDRQIQREFLIEQGVGNTEATKSLADIPPGMTKMQEAAWRKQHGL